MRQRFSLPLFSLACSVVIALGASVVLWRASSHATKATEASRTAAQPASGGVQKEASLLYPTTPAPPRNASLPPREATTTTSPSIPPLTPPDAAEARTLEEAEPTPRTIEAALQDMLGSLLFRTPLENPVVWRVPPAGGSPPAGGTVRDLVVLPNEQGVPVFGPIHIEGYRTVIVANLTLVPLASAVARAPAALTFVRTIPGLVLVASSSIDTRRADVGAVFLDARKPEADPTRVIIASSSLTVLDSRNAVGAFSWRGNLKRLEVIDSTVASNNLGLRLAPAASSDVLEDALLRRVHLQRTHTHLEQGRLLAVWGPHGTAVRSITLEDVWILPQKGVSLGELVFPGHILPPSIDPALALTIVRGKGSARSSGVWTFPSAVSGNPLVQGILHYGKSPQ